MYVPSQHTNFGEIKLVKVWTLKEIVQTVSGTKLGGLGFVVDPQRFFYVLHD